ncbi:MAG: hypothetical protein FJ295_14675 [Planctomycetes bacterium]|nr:hypothetical protein [Planctomycetota bacterium]
MTTHADRDPAERFSSGAYDGKRDGLVDTIGWVADMVNSGAGEPGKLLCSTNPAKLSEKINDYLGTITYNASRSRDLVMGSTSPAPKSASAATVRLRWSSAVWTHRNSSP